MPQKKQPCVLSWGKEKPTEPGIYFVRCRQAEGSSEGAVKLLNNGKFLEFGFVTHFEAEAYVPETEWFGPVDIGQITEGWTGQAGQHPDARYQ